MLTSTIRSRPSVVDDYISLADYQSHTPESFQGGKPVLHFHLKEAEASIPESQCGTLAIFPVDSPGIIGNSAASTNGDSKQVVKQTVEVFASTENFTMYSPSTECGVSLPYPSISIHAVKQVAGQDGASTTAVWMQLEFSDGRAEDDDFIPTDLTILPVDPADAQKLYDAIANCSNLHPDPMNGNEDDDEDDEYDGIVFEGAAEGEYVDGLSGVLRGATDGGLPPPMPGSGGWITADNVHEFFDAEGNWTGGTNEGASEELDEGAGRTRPRGEIDTEGLNGEGSESKRRRVEQLKDSGCD